MNEVVEYFENDELAASVFESKYKMKKEDTPDDMHKRLAKEFARKKIEREGIKYIDSMIESVYYNLFEKFKYIIPQGSVMFGLGRGLPVSLSNCIVLPKLHDSYGGICYADQQLAQLMKRRCGVGLDISTLRPYNSDVENAAKSSTGAASFMERFSNTTREVAQGGRRGALMISIDIRHPDVLEFITKKQDLNKVTGANVSVLLRDDFMEAVKEDKDYLLRFPCDVGFAGDTYEEFPYNELVEEGEMYVKRVKAKELWETIIECAHNTAEPGLMFLDRHWDRSPDSVYKEYKGHASNPCSEIFMGNDSCRLLALNLFSFVKNPFTKDAYFDYEAFEDAAYKQMELGDLLVDLEIEYIDKILEKIDNDPEPEHVKAIERRTWEDLKEIAIKGRRVGCGITALGDTLAALGKRYGSPESLSSVNTIMWTKMHGELRCQIDMARKHGTFKGWKADKEFYRDEDTGEIKGKNKFFQMMCDSFPKLTQEMIKYGRRNVSWSTVAPTGSLSILARTTSGMEPLFTPYHIRRKKVNPGDENVRVDYVDDTGDSWQEFYVFHPKFRDWLENHSNVNLRKDGKSPEELTEKQLNYYFKKSPWYGSTADDIGWEQRVKIQSEIQKFTTHSISSTVNLHNKVSKEQVSNIYMKAWKKGLKGITVYRDGSRSGVLIKTEQERFKQHDAPKRPNILKAHWFKQIIKGEDYTVLVGLMEEKPYEVFAFRGGADYALKQEDDLKIEKSGQGLYNVIDSDGKKYEITHNMNNPETACTRLLSTALRHGASVKFAMEQLNKTHGAIGSFSKAIARCLKAYVENGEASSEKCPSCDVKLVYEEGCAVCKSCGWTKCG